MTLNPRAKKASGTRPPVAVPCDKRIVIVHRGVTIADTTNAVRTLETSHPPTYYLSPENILMSAL